MIIVVFCTRSNKLQDIVHILKNLLRRHLPLPLFNFLHFTREIWRNTNPLLLTRWDSYFVPPVMNKNPTGLFNNLKNSSVVIMVCGKNNYDFFFQVLLKYCLTHLRDFACVVIDDGSSGDLESLKLKLARHNIVFLTNEGRGFQFALSTLHAYLLRCGLRNKIVFQMSHDCYPIIDNPAKVIADDSNLMISERIALMGINLFDYRQTRWEIKRGYTNKPDGIGMLGRRTLHRGDGGWIRSDAIRDGDRNFRYFEIEAPVDMSVLINMDIVMGHVKPNNNFWLFCWLDDISNTLLKCGETILVDKQLKAFHCQELKRKFRLPVNSVIAAKGGDKRYHSYNGHLEEWERKWGYTRGSKDGLDVARLSFLNSKIDTMIGRSGILTPYSLDSPMVAHAEAKETNYL